MTYRRVLLTSWKRQVYSPPVEPMDRVGRAALVVATALLTATLVAEPVPSGSLVQRIHDATRAAAGVDFTGEWAPRFHEDQPERVPGPELGDYLGIPINRAARMRGETWEASIKTLWEWQCRPYSADYIWRGPSPVRIWKEVDPISRQITAWHAEWLRSIDRQIYVPRVQIQIARDAGRLRCRPPMTMRGGCV